MSADAWDPAQYGRFREERRRPFEDLLALIHPVPGGRVVDLGSGNGELTLELHRHAQAAETIGIDRSAAMLAAAGGFAGTGVTFRQQDIAHFPGPADGRFDVIAANSSLHWVRDQPALLRRLAGALAEHGQLAFQVPANFDHPSHTLAGEVAAEAPFAAALAARPIHLPSVLAPQVYARLLYDGGFTEQHVRLQVYGHLLPSTSEVVEWLKGSYLTPFREGLAPDLYEEFLGRYRSRLVAVLGDQQPYFYPFKRILCWGRRP